MAEVQDTIKIEAEVLVCNMLEQEVEVLDTIQIHLEVEVHVCTMIDQVAEAQV